MEPAQNISSQEGDEITAYVNLCVSSERHRGSKIHHCLRQLPRQTKKITIYYILHQMIQVIHGLFSWGISVLLTKKTFWCHFMNLKKAGVPYCEATCFCKLRLEHISAHASLSGFFKQLQPAETRNKVYIIFLMTCYMCHSNASGSAFNTV